MLVQLADIVGGSGLWGTSGLSGAYIGRETFESVFALAGWRLTHVSACKIARSPPLMLTCFSRAKAY